MYNPVTETSTRALPNVSARNHDHHLLTRLISDPQASSLVFIFASLFVGPGTCCGFEANMTRSVAEAMCFANIS